MTTTNNNSSLVPTAPPQFTAPHYVQAGQIWRDNHTDRGDRLILVLCTQSDNVICQSLSTGKITSVKRSQFVPFHNRKTGFSLTSTLADINNNELNSTLQTLAHNYASLLTKHLGGASHISITVSRLSK